MQMMLRGREELHTQSATIYFEPFFTAVSYLLVSSLRTSKLKISTIFLPPSHFSSQFFRLLHLGTYYYI